MKTVTVFHTASGESSDALLRRAAALFTAPCADASGPALFDTVREPGKKPFFARCPELFFSVSHSGGVWAAAFSRDFPVGLDIQKIVTVRSMEGILRRFFHPAEREAVLAAPDPDRPRAFCRMWSRKEAAVKLSGRGIDNGFSAFDASDIALPVPVFGETVFLTDFSLPGRGELVCALAAPVQTRIETVLLAVGGE